MKPNFIPGRCQFKFLSLAICNHVCGVSARPLVRADLDDFLACFKSGKRHKRVASERFRSFGATELLARDKVNLDLFWLKDANADDPDSLPPPDEIAEEIVENLETALAKFKKVAAELARLRKTG